MLNIKYNMKTGQSDVNCVLCQSEGIVTEESQRHIFYCPTLSQKCENNETSYDDVFLNNTQKIMKVAKVFMKRMEIREKMMENLQKS